MNDNEKNLDELLEHALADYSNVEPRAGLEGRILATLATAEPETNSWRRWWAATGVAAVAAIALVIFIVWPKESAKTPQTAAKPTSGTPYLRSVDPAETIPKVAARSSNKAKSLRRPHADQRKTSESPKAQLALVKQPVFPTPSPLTEQEKLLFAYLRKTPAEELMSQAKADPPEPTDDYQQQNLNIPTRHPDLKSGK